MWDVVGVAAAAAVLSAWAVCRVRRSRASVAENEARYRALFTLMPSGALVVTADGRIAEFNEQAHAMLGYTRDEFAGLALRDLAADGATELEERLRRPLAGELLELESRLRDRSGEVLDVMVRARAAAGWRGPAVLVTFLDLTPRRRAEQSLRTAHRAVLALSRCNEMLVRSTTERALYDHLCRLVVEDGGYRMCWIGLAEHDDRRTVRPVAVAGHDDGYVASVGVVWSDTERGRGPTGSAIRSGRPVVIRDLAADATVSVWRTEQLRRGYRSCIGLPLVSDGKAFGAVSIYSTEPDAFDDAEVHFLTQLSEDVSFGVVSLRARADRDRLTAQLVQADRLAAMGTLAAGVAHEINNPLAYVVSSHAFMGEALGRLRERVSDPALGELSEALDDARDGAERVRQIVRDLRTFSRVDDARTGPADLHRVLDSSLGIAGNELKHRARVVKEYGPVPPVVANEAKLGQVFLNLLINAAQAIGVGRVDENEIRLVTSTDARGWARVEVSDTGAGILPELRDRIFDPFFTTKRVGEGTGLGLSICRNIVSAAGGEISVEAGPGRGRGATFRVALPPAAAAARGEPAAREAGVAPGRRGRVAVVDDEPAIRRAAARLLSTEHEVVAFEDARALAERIRAGERFDAILCDLLMPEFTGMDLHRVLRDVAPAQAEAMVFVTGGAFTSEGRAFIDTVRNPVLDKPFDAPAVRRAIRALVR